MLSPKVTKTTPGSAMYNEIVAYRIPDGTTTANCYNDRMAFIKYTSPSTGKTTNVQTGYSYGARLADYALQGLKNNMVSLDNGTIKTNQTFYTGEAQMYSKGLTAAAIQYKEVEKKTSGKLQYYYQDPDTSDGDESGYYNINSIYHANAVYGRRKATAETYDAKVEINCITIGPLAFVSAPNEMYDRYNYSGDQANNNLWDAFYAAAHSAGYITPLYLGYTNGSEGYIPNVAAYNYNKANNDVGSIIRPTNGEQVIMGTGAYEANTSNFTAGSGEQIIEHFQRTLLAMEELDRPTTCPMCGEENVQWDALWHPNTTKVEGGHYYLADDLVYYNGTNAFQRTIHADTCIDLNGKTAGNSSNKTGRAFVLESGVTLRMMNGTVEGRGVNADVSNKLGGVILMNNGSELYLTDVEVIREACDGQNSTRGGAIYAGSNCTVSLKDCSITGGVATQDGGNLYAEAGATLDLNSVTMTGGTATGTGDNMYVKTPNVHIYGDSVLKGESYFNSGNYATTKISGNVQACDSPDKVNIKLATNTRLTFGELSDAAKISIQGGACVTDPTGIALVGKQLVADEGFYLDTSFTNRGVFAGDKWMCECGGLAADKHTCEYHAYSPWTSSTSLPTVGNIYLTTDVVIESEASPSDTFKTLRIDLAGRDITRTVSSAAASSVFHLATADELLVVTDTSAAGDGTISRTLTDTTIVPGHAGLCIRISDNASGAEFRMYGGIVDAQQQTTTSGGGGAIADTSSDHSGYIQIYGGTVKGATANYGSGIYSKGKVLLAGGTITGGIANKSAGGVFINGGSLTLTGDASVTGNYLSNGTTVNNIVASASQLKVSGTYTGTAGIAVDNPAPNAVIGIADNANISGATLTVDGTDAYRIALSGNSLKLVSTVEALVMDAGGATYGSMAAALEAYTDSSKTLTLLADIDADFALTMPTSIDLAGHSITGTVSYQNDAKLILSDSSTADYTVEDGNGYGTVPGNANVVAAENYLAVTADNRTSVHKYDLTLTEVNLRPRLSGIYYMSKFLGDEIIRDRIDEFGVALRAGAAVDESYINADTEYNIRTHFAKEDWTSGQNNTTAPGTILTNILSPANGYTINKRNASTEVYGVAYIKFNDGSILLGANEHYSLKTIIETAADDQHWSKWTDIQKTGILELYDAYRSIMSGWNVDNLKAEYKTKYYAGQTVAFVGDSITYGMEVNAGERYWEHLQRDMQLGAVGNYGVSDSCYSAYNDRGHNYQPLIDRYQNIPGTDLIFIYMGTNDFSHETPLGTTADTTDVSLCGAMNIVLNGLKEAHPDSKIVLLTPINRFDLTTNDIGLTLKDYVDTIKAVGAYHDIPVLDLYTPSQTRLPADLFADKVHPTAEGHVILADMIQTLLEENKAQILGG